MEKTNLKISVNSDDLKKEIEDNKFNIDLSDHILHLKSFISRSECEQVVNYLKKIDNNHIDSSELYTDGLLNDYTDTFYDVDFNLIKEIQNKVLNYALKEYADKVRSFNWSYYNHKNLYMSEMIIRRYFENSEFKYHYDDIIDEIFPEWFGKRRSILTCNVYFSDPKDYTGGQLHFASCDKTYVPEMGDVILSPSNWMFFHKVKPVQSGTRYSGSFWIYYAHSPHIMEKKTNHHFQYCKKYDHNAILTRGN
jgi:hypothetical protein